MAPSATPDHSIGGGDGRERADEQRTGDGTPGHDRSEPFAAISIQHVARPVARMRPGEPGAQEPQLRLAERRRRGPAARERKIKLLHELEAGAIDDVPHRGDGRGCARREQRAAESFDAFTADHSAALGVAGGQRDQLHAGEVEVVDLAQEQIVLRPAGRRRREQDARPVGIASVGNGVRAEVHHRHAAQCLVQMALLRVAPQMQLRLP